MKTKICFEAWLGLALCLVCPVLAAAVGFASASPTTGADAFRAPVQAPKECVKGFLWLETEGFSDYGEWKLDTQFVHKMGSAYLLAAGVGKPIGSGRELELCGGRPPPRWRLSIRGSPLWGAAVPAALC